MRKVTNESLLLSEANHICAIIVNAVFEDTTWNNPEGCIFLLKIHTNEFHVTSKEWNFFVVEISLIFSY